MAGHYVLSQGTLEHRLFWRTHQGPSRRWEEHDEQEKVGQNLVLCCRFTESVQSFNLFHYCR